MKALIETNKVCQQVIRYDTVTIDGVDTHFAVWQDISNSANICQIEENQFDVAPDVLLWVECNSSVTTTGYYYDTSDSTIKAIVNADEPA